MALVVVAIVVGVLGAWQVTSARSSQRSQIVNGELTAARLASSALASGMYSRLQLVTTLANQNVADLISQESPPQLQKLADQIRALYPEFSSLAVDRADGTLLTVSPANRGRRGENVKNKPVFAGFAKTKKPYVSPAFHASGLGLVIGLAAPFYYDGTKTLAGVIVCTIKVSDFGSIIGSSHLQSGGSIVVLDQSASVLTGPEAGTRVRRAAYTTVSAALAGHEGTTESAVPGFSGNRFVAYSPVKNLGWAVLVEQPTSALNGPIGALTFRLALIDLLVLVVIVAAAVGLARLLAALASERDESAAVLASVGEGVAIVDALGRVVRLNPALERLSGLDTDSAKGRDWMDAFPFLDERSQVVPWRESVVCRAIAERTVVASHGFTRTLVTASGASVPVAVTAAPLVNDDGQVTGAVAVLRDVSREREVDELKSSLVSTVSHELRTPLTMIRGFSELLLSRSDLDSARSKQALEHIHDSSRRLGRLIDDLLSVSRIESGGLGSELRPTDLQQVVNASLVAFASNGGDRVVAELPGDLPAVVADPDQVVQVLTNLVSNALKYSKSNAPVRIGARVAGDEVHVSVTDHGIGMTPEEAAQVFGKFSRVDRPEVREVGGTGLGLYITRRLVDMMGGSIWVRSKGGEGSVFTFSLRVASPSDSAGDTEEQVYAQAFDR